MTVSC